MLVLQGPRSLFPLLPFPQAVPNKYLIDRENCLYAKNGKCKLCVQACPADCIDLDQPDQTVTVEVGNIIVAIGFQTFDAAKAENFGYGRFDNVLTSLEFERLVNAAGPTGGVFTMATRDKRKRRVFLPESPAPKKVAIIHCVGSRDKGTHSYCSRTCCMEALKFSSVLRDTLPDAAIYQAYSDMRAFGRDAEEFYASTDEKGVTFLLFDKLLPPTVTGAPAGDTHPLLVSMEEIATGESIEVPVDLVVLMVAAEARDDAKDVTKLVSISVDKDGFFIEKHPKLDPAATTTDGIYIAGNCQGPKDIPDCMAQAGATAARR